MATKQERKVIERFIDQLPTLIAWLDDTAYPRKDRTIFNESIREIKATFPGKWSKDALLSDVTRTE